MELTPNEYAITKKKRDEIKPDPFARQVVPVVRNPGKAEPKQIVVDPTRPAPRMRAHVIHSTATQSINDSTTTTVIFDKFSPASTVLYDTVGLLTATNEFKIPTIGKVANSWLLHAHITWQASAVGGRELQIVEGSTVISSTHTLGSNDQQSQDATILINDPPAGTLYKVQVRQTSGGPLNLLTEPEHTYFEIIHLW